MVEKTRDIDDPVKRPKVFIGMVRDVLNVEEPGPKKLLADIDQQAFMPGGAFYKRRHIIKNMRATFCSLVVDILFDGISKKVFKPKIARDVSKIAINLVAYLDGICMHYLIMEKPRRLKLIPKYYL